MKYIFIDEAGNLDFSPKGTKYFIFSFLTKRRPFTLENRIHKLKYDLIEWGLLNNNRLDFEYFHATEDNNHVREQMFSLIASLEEKNLEVFTFIFEKNKVFPDKRTDKDIFYINNLEYTIKKVLDRTAQEEFIIITDRLPIKHNKNRLIKGLKKGIASYLEEQNINKHYAILHHSSASNAYLQVIDYINWAIFRKYERNDSEFYKTIKKFIVIEEVMTKGRETIFY